MILDQFLKAREMKSTAIVYYAHDVTPTRIRELDRLIREIPLDRDIWVVGCCPQKTSLDNLIKDRVRVCSYLKEELQELPYPVRREKTRWSNMRGAPDLALLKFFQDHNYYKNYWFIEYDVRYTGTWGDLIRDLDSSEADLLATHISRRKNSEKWIHWENFNTADDNIDREKMVMGFLVICRASHSLMNQIDKACRQGWSGHPEAIWPTVANAFGYRIEEIGGNSSFTPELRRKKYYGNAEIPGVGRISNLTAWPFYSDKSGFIHRTKNLLWHPVKD